MVLVVPLALLIAAAPLNELDGRGADGTTPEAAVALRTSARLRAGMSAAGIFGVGGYAVVGGVGLAIDAGAIFNDRISGFVHVEVGLGPFTLIGLAGLMGEYVLGERFSVGLGVALSWWTPLPFLPSDTSSRFLGLGLPLRLSYALSDRAPGMTRRTGVVLGLQAAPALSIESNSYSQLSQPLPPQPGFTATFTVGYAWW